MCSVLTTGGQTPPSPLTFHIKPPLIHNKTPASAEINPLNQPSCCGGGYQRTQHGRRAKTSIPRGHHAAETLYTLLTWPNHQIWNTTNFSLSQRKDLMEAMAWSQRQEESRKKKCQKKRSKQWLGGWFSSGGAHRVPGTPGPLLHETRGYLWISFPPQRPRSEWEAAPHRWTEWAATQQRTHQWWCLSLKTRQNRNELRCPPWPGFYGVSWHRMCLRTSLSARGLSSHLVYTCKEGTQTSKHDQLRSVLSGIFTRNCFSERIGLKKTTTKKTSASATLLFMQRSSDGAVCSSPHNWAAGTARVKQRGDSGESLSDLRGCETQTPAKKKKKKRKSHHSECRGGEHNVL